MRTLSYALFVDDAEARHATPENNRSRAIPKGPPASVSNA
jgi:hypothetical protein